MNPIGAAKRGKKRTISTSEARKNFAAALQLVHEEKLIIGFDRYTQSVAALVPIEAVYILAGRGDELGAKEVEALERGAQAFLHTFPSKEPARPRKVARAVKAATKQRKAKKKAARKRAKAVRKKAGPARSSGKGGRG